jgi:acetyltransferase-like isoleucine patch superfamily enzyme
MNSGAMLNYRLPLPGRVVNWLKRGVFHVAQKLPGGRVLTETQATQVPIDFYRWYSQRILGINGGAYWPMHPSSTVSYPKRVRIGIETSPGWSPGCMISGVNGIYIGDYTQISQNVALLSGNHDPYNLPCQLPAKPIRIGKYCLLGMNSVILPEVVIGDYTIVGANSVVKHSFPEGFVVLAGVPAKVVKRLDPELKSDYRSPHEYHGYISAAEFAAFESQYLHLL